MSPVALLLENLACARRAGEPFHSAWPTAVGHVLANVDPEELRPWQRALEDTRTAWEASYDRRPPERRERALSLVADPTDREPIDDRPRCAVDGCDEIVTPHPRGGVKKFCSKRCTNRADQIRRREVKNARRRERRARLAAAA